MRIAIIGGLALCAALAGPGTDAAGLYTENTSHPRLSFTASDLPGLRQALASEPMRTQYQRLIARCDAYSPDDAPGGDAAWGLGSQLRDLAWVAALSAEQARADAAIELAMTVVRGSGPNWRKFMAQSDTTITLGLGLIYDMLHEALGPEQRRELAEAIRQRLEAGYVIAPPTVGGGPRTWVEPAFWSNQSARHAYALGMAALAIYGEVEEPRLDEWLALSTKAMRGYMETQVATDGVMYEGPGYASGTIQDFLAFGEALARAGGEDLIAEHTPQLLGVVRYLCHCLEPGGGHIVRLGQSFDEMQAAVWLGLAANLGNSQARWGWEQFMQTERADGRFFRAIGDGLVGPNVTLSANMELVWHGQTAIATAPPLPSAGFRDGGLASLRTGWGAEDIRLLITAGTGFCGGCPDKGSFVLQAMGETLATDIGYGALPSEQQNCLLIDGKGFPQGGAGKGRARLAAHSVLSPIARYARMDLTGAHELDLQRFWRHAAVVQAGGSWLVAIGDVAQVGDGKEHSYEWTLVTAPGNRFAVGPDGRVRITGKRRGAILQIIGAQDATIETDVIRHRWTSRFGQENSGDFPRLRIKRSGPQGRFLVLIYPASGGPKAIEQLMTEDAMGARITWGAFSDTLRFAAVEPGPGEAWWELRRSTGEVFGESVAPALAPASPPAAAALAGPPPAAPGEFCPASALETDLGANVLRGMAPTPFGTGVGIMQVGPEGLAARLGLKVGDVVLSCNDTRTTCPKDLQAVLQRDTGKPCLMTIYRDGEKLEVRDATGAG